MNRTVPEKAPVVVNKVAVTATATTPVRINTAASGVFEVTLVCDQDCYVVFSANAATPVADATDGWPLYAKQYRTFYCGRDTAFLSVVRVTADGTLRYYFPGQTA